MCKVCDREGLSQPRKVQFCKDGYCSLYCQFFDEKKLRKDIREYLKRYSLKDVVKLVSEKNNLSKKKVYNICLSIKKK